MLVVRPDQAGVQSGLMMLQYTAASLVLENEGLASPASVRSLPTSADQEDHNANATTAARELLRVLGNVERIVAIEMCTAAQALDLRLRVEGIAVRAKPSDDAGTTKNECRALYSWLCVIRCQL